MRTTGGANGYATLTGTGPIGVLYFYQGALTAAPGIPALIAAIPLSDCSTYGQLGFAQDDSDKCALYNTFDIQSDTENSQLGAQLTFNYVGGFYACGSGQDVSVIFRLRPMFTDVYFRYGIRPPPAMALLGWNVHPSRCGPSQYMDK